MNINAQMFNSMGKATPVPPPPEEIFSAAPKVTPAPSLPTVQQEQPVTEEAVAAAIEETTTESSEPSVEEQQEPVTTEEPVVEKEESTVAVSRKESAPRSLAEPIDPAVFVPTSANVVTQRFGEVKKQISSIKRPPQNIGLKTFIAQFKENENVSLEQEIVFAGESVRRTEFPGVWEEGGATYGQEGSVLLITDPTGGRKSASMAYHDKKFANGKHALIRVEEGDNIIVGYRLDDFEIVAMYQITNMHMEPATVKFNKDGSKYTPPNKWDITGKLRGALVPSGDSVVWEYASDTGTEILFDQNTPCLKAAVDRLHEQFTHTPCYIKTYNKLTFDDTEWNKLLSDTAFMSSTQVFTDLTYLYASAGEVAKDKLFDISREESINTIIIVDSNTDKPGVWVCVYVTVYDHRRRTSEGKRLFAGCVFLDKDANFFYDDERENIIPCAQIVEAMKHYPIDPKTGQRRLAGTMLKRVTM